MYNYNVELKRVIDGDTIVCDVDLGFGIWLRDEHIRFARIDCPETRTKDIIEKQKGLAAKDFVSFILGTCKTLKIQTQKDFGKYGRYIAEILVDDKNLNDLLVQEGLAEYVDY